MSSRKNWDSCGLGEEQTTVFVDFLTLQQVCGKPSVGEQMRRPEVEAKLWSTPCYYNPINIHGKLIMCQKHWIEGFAYNTQAL